MKRGIQHNTHPGEQLREEVVKVHNFTTLKASQLLKVTSSTLSKILNGRSAKTLDNLELWILLQASYTLREAEEDLERILYHYKSFI